VELVSMIGEEDPENVSDQVRSCAERNPGAYRGLRYEKAWRQ
jgi:tetrahydromethanopterin S-methyltransferase subunit A